MSQRIVAHRIELSEDRKSVIATHKVSPDKGGDCQVEIVIDADGNVSDPHCVDDGCPGDCELRGTGTSYWCACVVVA